MGGGAGYIYAALSAVRDAHGLRDEDLLRGLFVAGGVGAISFDVSQGEAARKAAQEIVEELRAAVRQQS